MAPAIRASEQFTDVHFPFAGVDVSAAFERQPVRPTAEGLYARTTPTGQNVRAFEAITRRMRGGVRPGLAKYVPVAPNGASLVQGMAVLVTDLGGAVQSSQSGRVVTLVAVSQGEVRTAAAGATTWSTPTNNTAFSPPLNATGILYSASNNQKLYFADGSNWCYFDPVTGSLETWVATAGSLPVDDAGNTPRLICTWRGRTVLSGLIFDPQDWFMSRVGDPTDFDYAPLSPGAAQAVAGISAPQGIVGDVVTALIPYTDDVLVFGCDHSIYMMRGDPMAGGSIDLISDTIGMAWGAAWCKDPFGTLYFMSNKMGVYALVPGQAPQRVSGPIDPLLYPLDSGLNTFLLIWDDRWQGFHLFVTPTAAAAVTTHYFYEARAGAWWTDQFASNAMNPLACCTFDGNNPGDRAALIGSWDGYVRYLSPDATNDDGITIQSSVVLGPINTPNMDEMLLKDIQAILAASSGPVIYSVFVGATAELALSSAPVAVGTWSANRNLLTYVRRSGHAVYVQLTSSFQWAMEAIRLRVATTGKVRRRGL
jgi:hypothetical protein